MKAHLRGLDVDYLALDASPRDKEVIMRVPGARYDRKLDTWTLPRTWGTCVGLRAEYGDQLTMSEDVRLWATGTKAHLAHLLRLKETAWVSGREGDPLFPFQGTGHNWLTHAGQALLTDEPGLGKTIQAIRAVERLGEAAWPVLVICPQTVKHNWAAEFAMWMPGTVCQVIGGTPAQKAKQFAAAKESGGVVIINWQSMWRHTRLTPYGSQSLSPSEAVEHELNEFGFQTVIADEAHRAVDPKAKQTRGWWTLSHAANYRLGLTGTPVVNKPDDLWALLHGLRPLEYPRRSKFIERYCNAGQGAYGWEVWGLKEEAKAELFSFLDPRMLRRTKAEVLPQLPPKQFQTRWVEMEGKQAATYRALKKEMLAEVGGNILTVSSPLVLVGRLTQAAAGTPVLEEVDCILADGAPGRRVEVVALSNPSCKVAALLDIMDERPDEKLVVFASSRKLIELVADVMATKKVPHILLTGEVSAEDRQANVARFQDANDNIRVALCTIGASSEGITLTAAKTAVFLQRGWSNVQYLQACDRVHRVGQTAQVTIIDVVTFDTIEASQHARIADKDAHLQEVLRDALR